MSADPGPVMSGPEHYLEADRLVQQAQDDTAKTAERVDAMLKAAQVHATLAGVAWEASGTFSRTAWMAATIKRLEDDPGPGVLPS